MTRSRRPIPLLCAGALALAAAAAPLARGAAPPAVWPEAEFCGRAQNFIVE